MNQTTFAEQLSHLYGRDGLMALQIGAFAGHASAWLCDFLLTGEDARLHDVDTWEGSDEDAHRSLDFAEVRAEYRERVAPFGAKVVPYECTSDEFFTYHARRHYDFIYIDGDHHAAQVLRDAVNADTWLKVGGILAFDDYLWGAESGRDVDSPAPAIDAFVKCFQDRYEVLLVSGMVWLRKVA